MFCLKKSKQNLLLEQSETSLAGDILPSLDRELHLDSGCSSPPPPRSLISCRI